MLYVDEETSVLRQLQRAKRLELENAKVKDTGLGSIKKARATDVSEELARQRYRVFKVRAAQWRKGAAPAGRPCPTSDDRSMLLATAQLSQEEVYDALKLVKDHFFFHFLDAGGSPEDVKDLIQHEFTYQSSLELGDETFDSIRLVPEAKQVVAQARQNMVQRLNAYVTDHPELFRQVVEMVQTEFVHILRRQALAGRAIIRTNNTILSSKIALNMLLDILSERGFFVTLEVQQESIPTRVEPAVPGDFSGQPIRVEVNRVWKFEVEFPRPNIRRGD